MDVMKIEHGAFGNFSDRCENVITFTEQEQKFQLELHISYKILFL